MEPGELTGPLASYQSTVATHADTHSMARQLFAPIPANASDFDTAYDKAWTTLANGLAAAQYEPLDQILTGLEARFEKKTFDEPVAECHSQAWSDRIAGCHETLHDLRRELSEVKRRCRPYEVELFRQVIWRLDLYEASMQAYLIDEKHWELRADGSIDMPDKIRNVCERRRREVKTAIAGLLDPARAPVFDSAPVFDRLETFAERKNLIHRQAALIRQWIPQETNGVGDSGCDTVHGSPVEPPDWRTAPVLPPPEKFKQAIGSEWNCDRIFYYLAHIECLRATLPSSKTCPVGILDPKQVSAKASFWVEEEIQRIRASAHPAEATRMPLYYALRLVLTLAEWPNDAGSNPLGLLDPGAVERLQACLDAAIEIEKDNEASEVRRKAELLKKRFALA